MDRRQPRNIVELPNPQVVKMRNVFIINAHEQWPLSEGKLNCSLAERATANLKTFQRLRCWMSSVLEDMGYSVSEINDFSIKGII